MPNLNTFSTLHERVKNCAAINDLEGCSTAFMWVSLETICQLNPDDIDDVITDGGQDGGIDAIHITARNVSIFSFKYTEKFENTAKNFPEGDLDSLVLTASAIISKSLTQTTVNAAVWDKVLEIWSLAETGALTFRFYICSNKLHPTDAAKKKFEDALRHFRFIEFHYLDQEDLVNKLLERKYRRVDGALKFIDKQHFERVDGQVKGVVATVAAVDLVKLVVDPADNTRVLEDAFNDNVRIYQKRNRINQRIIETALSDTNSEFWYLNNGITIVCEECVYQPGARAPHVALTDFQIVNGGQTTHALVEAFQKDAAKLDSVLLLVRICVTKRNHSIADKISETTNSQTPVTTRDLHANDRIQRKLEEEFKSLGMLYERKANQFANQGTSKRLNNELLAQLYLAFYLDMPSEAKNSKSLVFGDKYDDIFSDSTTAQKLLLPLKFYEPLQAKKKIIQSKKRKKEPIDEREAFISRAIFHIVNVARQVAEKERIDLIDTNVSVLIEKAIQHVGNIVRAEQLKRGELYTHDKFFKESQTNRIICDYLDGHYKPAAQ